jgi:hypothetical protein
MKKQTSVALAAAMLLGGMTVASAAALPPASANTAMAPPAKDTLSLSRPQQKTAWNDLYMKSLTQKAPSTFTAKVGAVVPKSITTAPVPGKAASDVPALRHYDFAMLKGKVLIVNPKDNKVAEVITG